MSNDTKKKPIAGPEAAPAPLTRRWLLRTAAVCSTTPLVSCMTSNEPDDAGGNGEFEGDAAGECSDAADNDQDGLFDCADPDCVGSPDCTGDDDDSIGDDDTAAGDDDSAAGDDDSAAGDDDLGDDDSAFDVPDGPPPLPDDPITVGTVDNIEMNSLTPVESEAVAIGRDEDGLWAVGLLCTHLGCTIGVDSPDKSQISYAQGIECGCHGSEFTRDGLLVFGPANRALDCFLVSIGSSGAVTIDMQTEVDPGDRTSTDS